MDFFNKLQPNSDNFRRERERGISLSEKELTNVSCNPMFLFHSYSYSFCHNFPSYVYTKKSKNI